jgi:hypothetical protein
MSFVDFDQILRASTDTQQQVDKIIASTREYQNDFSSLFDPELDRPENATKRALLLFRDLDYI